MKSRPAILGYIGYNADNNCQSYDCEKCQKVSTANAERNIKDTIWIRCLIESIREHFSKSIIKKR